MQPQVLRSAREHYETQAQLAEKGTPRTDDWFDMVPEWGPMVSADFARTLERELLAEVHKSEDLKGYLKDAIVTLEVIGTYQSISKAVELRKVIGWGE